MFKQDETTSQEKIYQKDQNGTSLLLKENLERQKNEGNMIVLPIFKFLSVFR